MTRVGMPRGMMFYKYFPFWQTFLEGLDVELVASEPTNKEILGIGVEVAEGEFCLPLKVFHGHCLSLRNQVDALLIPRLVSVHKDEYTCPKMLGLPDLIRMLDDQVPPIISPLIDMHKNRHSYFVELYKLGRQFTDKRHQILKAYQRAVSADKAYHEQLRHGVMPIDGIMTESSNESTDTIKVGLIGHPYNIFDSYTSSGLVKRLSEFGVRIVVPEHIEPGIIESESLDLSKKLFWSYEKEIVGAAFHWLKTQSINGIIYVLAFACGPDSFIQAVIEHRANELGNIPVMSLVIDEHSTEVGMVTRLEAFVDMLQRQERVSERPALST